MHELGLDGLAANEFAIACIVLATSLSFILIVSGINFIPCR